MKSIYAGAILCVSVAAAFAGRAFAYTDYPLYVVNVADNGETNMLDSATVRVYATAETTEADAVDQAFSSLSLTTGTFVKRGDGWLRSSQAMQNFTGTFYIEEGEGPRDRHWL